MKNLYYFSKQDLRFIEVKNYKKKFVSLFLASFLVFCGILFGAYSVFSTLLNSDFSYRSLKNENRMLTNKLSELVNSMDKMSKGLDSLSKFNNDLRIAANLPPITAEERKLGTGGGSFDNSLDFLKSSSELKIKEALNYVDQIQRKLEFEKSNNLEISNTIKQNQKLFEAIPAIKPADGVVGEHGFGMRMHPILHVMQMHDGIDLLTNVGTPVVATGKGVIDFVGYKGGYGLEVEIDHGFGYRTVYGHLSSSLVQVGKKVNRGDLIAKTGNTGLSSGPHLHYEVHYNGIKQDPMGFFFDNSGFFEFSKK
jgi:murein DD-endopeptidase MepM/ murein hydrolase activator NlpD